jgi:hypothetical protein
VPELFAQIGFNKDNVTIEIDVDIHNPSFSEDEMWEHKEETKKNHGPPPKTTDPYDVQNTKFWECATFDRNRNPFFDPEVLYAIR